MDVIDIANNIQEFNTELSLLKQRERIQSKSVSECCDCGGEIEYLRRKAIPEAIRCYECQRKHEFYLKVVCGCAVKRY